ncbi:hypothetical protein [Terriglobus roseus]|uniref:Uncharacterized protein n=1 Tax=Terriglobus roseus TaxID=392734 RepID=A0A1G7G578_9BACT|nr:hypothetical protein [Terriglobus roseus]SDE83247.1 hypothetical protein SAMN05444167_0555 [Terriglobus roseus]
MTKKEAINTDEIEIEKIQFKSLWKTAPSLKPSVGMMDACARGDKHAKAIRDAWRFKAPVVTLSHEEYAELIERCTVTFNG